MGTLGSSWSSRSTLSNSISPTGGSTGPLLGQTARIANPYLTPLTPQPTTTAPSQTSPQAAPALTAALKDQVVSRFSSLNPSAVAHQPNLVSPTETKAANAIENYLNAEEIDLVKKLQPQLRQALLAVKPSTAVGEVRTEMVRTLKGLINDLVPSGKVTFKGSGNRDWDLQNLLNLANAVQRMPLAQRNQLKGITFERSAKAEMPEGAPDNLLTRVAQEITAGHYSLENKTVVLYDRATHDDFPAISQTLQNSLRHIAQQTQNSDIAALQHMLNPYLEGMGEPKIETKGNWNQDTERAVRLVQVKVLEKHLNTNYTLSSAQKQELKDLKTLAASPHFDTITRMTDIHKKMQNLNLLPDTQMKQLLTDFAGSDFGSASLQFIMQDLSENFGSTKSVSFAEGVLTHEMGHHIQLGQEDSAYYVQEFSKLGQWFNVENKEVSNGYIGGAFASEDVMDVYNVLASNGSVDKGAYRSAIDPEARGHHFVSTYATTDPMEDFAESYKTFLIEPETLMEKSPEKFFFLNAMPAIQQKQTGNDSNQTQYTAQEILSIASKALTHKWGQEPTDLHVQQFIREKLENLTINPKTPSQLQLSPQAALGIFKSHEALLSSVDMPNIQASHTLNAETSGNAAVYATITENAQKFIQTQGKDPAAKTFFTNLRNPAGVERLFPKASPELKKQLKDPAFSSMMLAVGEIAGHAVLLNQMRIDEHKDEKQYQEAQSYFGKIMTNPEQLLSRRILSYSYDALRSVGSKIYNPETSRASASLQFFEQLKTNPNSALSTVWKDLPENFKNKLNDRSFIKSISGDEGRYLPSAEAIQGTLTQIMSDLEFDRMMKSAMAEYE